MAELNRIQQQVYDCIREHNDPAGLGSDYYYYMYCCSGRTDVQSREAFDELLEELEEEKLLKSQKDDKGARLYSLVNEEKHEAGNVRGQAFGELQAEFIAQAPEKLAQLAKEAMLKFMAVSGIKDSRTVVMYLVLAASIGTEGKTALNPPEKKLVNASFGSLLSNSMDFIYRMMEQPLDEQAFGMMTVMCNVGGRETGLSLLRVILAFAYADGEMSNEIGEKLEKVFTPVLEKK